MKHLMTLIALVVAVTAGAQGTTIYEYPWNPDSNNDNLIGVDDLLDFLPVFGDEFGLPPEPCDYDGSSFEDLMIGVADGTIILDSMFIEYELEDISTYYILGCPEPTTDTLVFVNSVMLVTQNLQPHSWFITGTDDYGYYNYYQFNFNLTNGYYEIGMGCNALYYMDILNDGFFGGAQNAYTESTQLPLPSDWSLDGTGIHIDSGWNEQDYPYYANYLHILPYWHYAE